MTWLQVDLHVRSDDLAELEARLQTHGAAALTLISDAAEVVLEPAPGETPIWSSICLRALFPIDVDVPGLREILASVPRYDVEVIGEEDWQARANNHAVNHVFADRLWLLPRSEADHMQGSSASSARELQDFGGPVPLYLDPGLAFGSGSHPTTRLCLTWLATHVQQGMRVLDFGCGSGVLGIGAALLGAEVVAVDHDPQAIVATQQNAAYNGVADGALIALESTDLKPQDFDIVVANILAAPLMDLAEEFEITARRGAYIVLSGILAAQVEAVAHAYEFTDFDSPDLEEGWALLSGVCHRAQPAHR